MYLSRYGLRRVLTLLSGVFIFLLAIQLMKEGAGALAFILEWSQTSNPVNTLGFGWLFSYFVLSGSPVAASAITLLEEGVLSEFSTFMMINGSRLGASFIVLMIGFVYVLRGKGRKVSTSIGLLAFIATATIYSVGIVIGYALLSSHLFDFLEVRGVSGIGSALEMVFSPIVNLLGTYYQGMLLFATGLLILLGSFRILDRGLPQIRLDTIGNGRWSGGFYNPKVMFTVGSLVTLITMSVSVSLSLLVPLAVRGHLKNEKTLPYIMGANITTFIDTLFVAVVLGSAVGVKIVLIEIISVAIPTVLILFLLYGRYEALQLRLLHHSNGTTRRLAIFVGVIFIIPLILYLI